MTRINTNVSSLIAQKTLGRSNSQLQETLTRLSTGLRINAGKDDPAGLIASENLRRDITSANKAISNTERAAQLISTADSALGQISNLLNDIRGLVVEAANSGVLSDEQIAANQLQVDSSLEAIDRIAQVTTFQGRKLLDGSLDFQVGYTAGGATVRDLAIQQANLGTLTSLSVSVEISTAATRGIITNDSFTPVVGVQATGTVALTNSTASIDIAAVADGAADGAVGNATDVLFQAATAAQAGGTLSLTGGDIAVDAVAGGAADGVAGNSVDVVLQAAVDIAQAGGTSTLTGGSIDIDAVAGGAADGVAGDATVVTYQAAADIAQAAGTLTLTNTSDTINIAAVAGGAADGAAGNVSVVIAEGVGATAATYDSNTNTITINVDNSVVGGDTTANIASAIANISGGGVFTATATGGAAQYVNTDDNTYAGVTSGGDDGTTGAVYAGNTITVSVAIGATITDVAGVIDGLADFAATAASGGGNDFDFGDFGTQNNVLTGGNDGTTDASFAGSTLTVNVGLGATIAQISAAIDGLADFTASTASVAAFDTGDLGTITDPLTGGDSGTTSANYDENTNVITVNVAVGADVDAVAAAIDGLADFTASAASGGANAFDAADYGNVDSPLAGGVTESDGSLTADLVLKIAGQNGSEAFTFEAGATLEQIVNAINLVQDATGVRAVDNAGDLDFESTGYGSAAIVDIEVLSEGVGGAFEAAQSARRTAGTDIVARVNGTTASGRGNTLSINTATLDLSLTVDDGSATTVDFSITGGGAIFQIGPNVVSNNQVRVGVGAVNTASLGGIEGRLFELRSGNAADLSTDTTLAASIVDSAIDKVTGLRGRLGAFQRTTLETNIASLNDTVTNLTEAESSIRDADFAAETARLTRAQILVQSGTAVLQIANQNPQNVLGLLRG
jgi:flagellin